MLTVFFGAIVTVLSVLGLGSLYILWREMALSLRQDWRAELTLAVKCREETPIPELLETVDYVQARYFPGLLVDVSLDGLPEEKKKEAEMLLRRRAGE